MEKMFDKVSKEGLEKFLIIDGNSIMNRAFYGIRLLSTKDGLYTNAIYGFLNIYYMILDKLNPKYVGIAFDLKAPTFRHEMFEDYKAQRKGMPDELKVQMPVVKEVLKAMNVPIFEIEGYEADDILGTVSKENTKKGIFTYILTGDKDSLQLISDTTSIIMPITKMGKTEYTVYDKEALKEKYGIEPLQVIDVKALMGDTSDNIPGVKGIGEKTAYTLVTKYSSINNIYENITKLEATPSVIKKLEEGKDSAYSSYKLATIYLDVPIEINYDKLKLSDVNLPELISLFNRLSFRKFIERYEKAQSQDMNISSVVTNEENDFYKEFNADDMFSSITVASELKNILDEVDNNSKVVFYYLTNTDINEQDMLIIKTKAHYSYIPVENLNEEMLKTFCESSIVKIGYDIKSFIYMCMQKGIKKFNNFYSDLKIAYYLLHATESNYTIKNIVYNTLNVNLMDKENYLEENEIEKKIPQTSLFDVLDNSNVEKKIKTNTKFITTDFGKKYCYGILNSIEKINDILIGQIKELNMDNLYFNIEMPLIETLATIENIGMYVDKDKLNAFGKEISAQIDILSDEIISLAGEEFNINSPMQLGKILFEKLGLPSRKKTKSSYSTDKETLDSLSDKHEIINKILEYRTLSKLKSTYVDGLLSVISEDGRVHTTFMQAVTATGRLSSIEPNLQNIPVRTEIGSKIRECFVPESNNIIVDADYSQIELRVLAHMSQDETMIKAFNEGKDIHAITASQVFNVPIEEVTSELRSKAKAVNFGIVYGISAFGLAKNISSTRGEAEEYINNYFEKYNKVKEYMDSNIIIGEQKGYVSTMFGRIRYIEELKASNKNVKQFGERVAMNMPIQGTAADIMKKAMNDVYEELNRQNLKSKIIMQVHDELLIEAPENEVQVVCEILKNKMENVITLDVPLKIDVHYGNSWAEAK